MPNLQSETRRSPFHRYLPPCTQFTFCPQQLSMSANVDDEDFGELPPLEHRRCKTLTS